MSNRGMRQTIFIVTSLLLTFCPCAQDQSADQMQRGAIQRVKTLLVSSLDRSLSKATLVFFLKYEGEGAIKWEVNDGGNKLAAWRLITGATPPCAQRPPSISRTAMLQPSWSQSKRSRGAQGMFQPS